jgi:hypothetical protein
MIKRPIAVSSLAAAVAALGACAAETDTTADIRAPAATAIGEPVSCIQTNTIRGTRVHDDRTIDFEMTNGRTYRNTLPIRCSGLGFEERFAYKTTIGRLCSTDTITVLQSGGINGPTCGLGEFVPVQLTGSLRPVIRSS